MKDTVVKPRDNEVVFVFDFDKDSDFYPDGLNRFTDIEVQLETETYKLSTDPQKVVVKSAEKLALRIGPSTNIAKGAYEATIIGFSPTYPNGRELTSPRRRVLRGKVKVVE